MEPSLPIGSFLLLWIFAPLLLLCVLALVRPRRLGDPKRDSVRLNMPQPMPDTVPIPQPDSVPPPTDLPQQPTPPEVQEPVLPGEHSPVSDPALPGRERQRLRA